MNKVLHINCNKSIILDGHLANHIHIVDASAYNGGIELADAADMINKRKLGYLNISNTGKSRDKKISKLIKLLDPLDLIRIEMEPDHKLPIISDVVLLFSQVIFAVNYPLGGAFRTKLTEKLCEGDELVFYVDNIGDIKTAIDTFESCPVGKKQLNCRIHARGNYGCKPQSFLSCNPIRMFVPDLMKVLHGRQPEFNTDCLRLSFG